MDIVKVFANNVKKYRTEKGLSQEAFAEKNIWNQARLRQIPILVKNFIS